MNVKQLLAPWQLWAGIVGVWVGSLEWRLHHGHPVDSGGNRLSSYVYGPPNITNASGTLPLANMTQGTADQVLGENHAGTAAAYFTVGGDCTLSNGNLTCTKINGTAVPAGGALSTGNACYVSGSSACTYGTLNLASSGYVGSSILPVANGGSGAATFTAHGVLLGEGASAHAVTSAGASAALLLGQGASADPTFNAMSQDCTISSSGAMTCTGWGGGAATYSARQWTLAGGDWTFLSSAGNLMLKPLGTGNVVRIKDSTGQYAMQYATWQGTPNSENGVIQSTEGFLRTVSSSTPTTILTLPITNAVAHYFAVYVDCRAVTAPTSGSIGDSWASEIGVLARAASGTATVVGSSTINTAISDTSMTATALSTGTSTSNALIKVANVSSATVDCTARAVEIQN